MLQICKFISPDLFWTVKDTELVAGQIHNPPHPTPHHLSLSVYVACMHALHKDRWITWGHRLLYCSTLCKVFFSLNICFCLCQGAEEKIKKASGWSVGHHVEVWKTLNRVWSDGGWGGGGGGGGGAGVALKRRKAYALHKEWCIIPPPPTPPTPRPPTPPQC